MNHGTSAIDMVRKTILLRLSLKVKRDLTATILERSSLASVDSGKRSREPIQYIDRLSNFATGNGIISLMDIPWSPIFFVILFVFHPMLGLVALAGTVVIIGLALMNDHLMKPPAERKNTAKRISGSIEDIVLDAGEVVNAMGMFSGLSKQHRDNTDEFIIASSETQKVSILFYGLAALIRTVMQVAILGTGAYLAIQQEITAGMIVASSIMMGRAVAPFAGAISTWPAFLEAKRSYKDLNDYMATNTNIRNQEGLSPKSSDVAVKKLVVAPPSKKQPVIKGLSFNVNSGEILAVMGRSGAGKSTLARALIGIWPPSNGGVYLDGINLARWASNEAGEYLGYLPQNVELLNDTVWSNISRHSEYADEDVISAAILTGVHEDILKLEKGYDTTIGPNGSILPGGMRQKIGLARAFFRMPKFIVLDEPNSNLDDESEGRFLKALVDLKNHGSSIVVISHKRSILEVSDKIMMLEEGVIKQFGKPQLKVVN